jgi:hypothetical protein
MTFKEWMKSLEPKRNQTSGEDLADTIGLFILMGLVCLVIFL